MKWPVAALALVGLLGAEARAQELPNPAALAETLGGWHVDAWATDRIAQNRARCRNATTGRLALYVRHPEDLSYYGARYAQWELYGDDYDIVALVQFAGKTESSRMAVWCEFEPDGTLKNIRLKTQP